MSPMPSSMGWRGAGAALLTERALRGFPKSSAPMWARYVVAISLALLAQPTAAFAAVQSSPAPAATATPTPAPVSPIDIAHNRIDTMLRTGHADPAWFSATFLAEYPASKIDDIVASLKSSLGEYRSLEFTPTNFIAHFAKGTDDIRIHLDANNAIDALLFRPPVITA
jgi:hypothetical protein